MKKYRIILSVVAVAFAVISAFASKSEDVLTFGYKTISNGQEICNQTSSTCPVGANACVLNVPEDSSPLAVPVFERSQSVCSQQGTMN